MGQVRKRRPGVASTQRWAASRAAFALHGRPAAAGGHLSHPPIPRPGSDRRTRNGLLEKATSFGGLPPAGTIRIGDEVTVVRARRRLP
jgi:hypothetical protein